MDKKKKNRLILLACLLFFFGFPLAGMLFVYNQAHSTMRESAIPFAQEKAQRILAENDFEELYFLGTLTLKGTTSEEDFLADRAKWGALKSLGEFTATDSTIIDRSDQMWQLIDLQAEVEFENGAARLEFQAARRSTILQDWRIERFEVTGVNVE